LGLSAKPFAKWPWWPAVAFLLPAAWCLQDVVVRGRLLSYRDSLTFYYPLFEFVQQEWEAGRIPLWNPYTSGGEPLLASPTSSVLYPLKGVFFLPLSYWARYHLYVLIHVALAGASCGWVARRWGASLSAATLAATSYALCGNVLFATSNVVFLCGAAWLPLALWAGDRMLVERSLRCVPLLAAVLALMTFAGDPEMAYVAGLLIALQALLRWRRERHESKGEIVPAGTAAADPAPTGRRRRLVLLAAAAGLALLLAAPQVLPTLDWSRESLRTARKAPLSIYDIPRFLMQRKEQPPRWDTLEPPQWYDALVGNPPPPARHEGLMYEFSFELWRLVEYVWPNVSGRRFPRHQQWGEILGWNGKSWTTSQYMGLLPFLLALSAWRVRRTDARTCWLSWIALLATVASFGRFGPGQLFLWEPSSVEVAFGQPHWLTRAVGGLYWLMATLLPGFAEFRYPAKLLVPAACAGCLLSARGLDALLARRGRGWQQVSAGIAIVSAAVAVTLLANRSALVSWLEDRKVGVEETFHAAGAFADVQGALWHAVAASLLIAAVLRWAKPVHLPAALLALTAVDLALANRCLVATTDRKAWEQTPDVVSYLAEASRVRRLDVTRPPRIHRPFDWYYPLPSSLADHDHSAEVAWHRATLYGNQNLPFRIPVTIGRGSLESHEQETWFEHFPLSLDPPVILQSRRAFDAWGTAFFVIPDESLPNPELSTVGLLAPWGTPEEQAEHPLEPVGRPPLDGGIPGRPRPTADAPDLQVLYNDSAFPPAWIVHRVRAIEPIPHTGKPEWVKVTAAMAYPLHQPFDLRQEAIVEDAELLAQIGPLPVEWPPTGGERCRLVRYEPQEAEVEVELASPGLVVLSDMYTHDWTVQASRAGGPFEPAPLFRTNRTMRGVLLPAGAYVIRFQYRPWSFYVGCAAGAAALSICLLALVLSWWRARQGR
jgi:hypothetical protein